MSNKIKVLHDGVVKRQDEIHITRGQQKGRCMAYVHGTDIPLWEKAHENKVIVPGSAFTAAKHFAGINVPVKTPTYNTSLGLDEIVSVTDAEERQSFVYLWAVGIGGCGPEDSQVYDVDYTKWIAPSDLIPFRYEIANHDLSSEKRGVYFGRKDLPENDRIAYYFKAFDSAPVFKQQYVDGTPIDENIYISDNTLDVESYVELKMSVLRSDCRDYFIYTTGINDARINSISLLTAFPKTINGYTYYQNIRPLTKLNFPNESLIDLTKAIDFVYQIFY